MELTISGKDKKLLRQVENLAKELGLKISKKKSLSEGEEKENSNTLYELMSKKAAEGGIESIKDPVAWQREVRKDKKLYGRDE